MTNPAMANDTILISSRKVGRDLLILIPLLLLIGYGIRESNLFTPVPPVTEDGSGVGMSQAHVDAPEGTSPEVLAILAHLDEENPTIVATIGDQEISRGDLDARATTMLTRMNQALGENLKPEVQAEILRVQVFMEISKELAEEAAATQMGVVPDETAIEAEMLRIEEQFGSPDELDSQLTAMGTDRDGMRSLTRRNLQVSQLQEKVLAQLNVAADAPDAAARYDKWLSEQVAALQVQVLDPDFKASMTRIIELFNQAAEDGAGHGGHGAGALPPSHPPVEGAPDVGSSSS